jgi:hypothetical protein
MNDQELEILLLQLSEHERNLLIQGINVTAANILLKMFPDNVFIQNLVKIKSS